MYTEINIWSFLKEDSDLLDYFIFFSFLFWFKFLRSSWTCYRDQFEGVSINFQVETRPLMAPVSHPKLDQVEHNCSESQPDQLLRSLLRHLVSRNHNSIEDGHEGKSKNQCTREYLPLRSTLDLYNIGELNPIMYQT